MISNVYNHGNEFKSIVAKDVYGVKDWKEGSFDVIFDIGANIGFFSVFMAMRHSWSKIVALEPCIEVCNYLKQNVNMLNVVIEEKALGDGIPLQLKARGHLLDAMFVEKGDGYKVESISLKNLFDKYCDSSTRYFIKLNCEGGEKYLMNKESELILQNASQVSMQIHFKTDNTPFDNWLTLEEHQQWIADTFINHKVKYYKLSVKRGIAFYRMRKNV